MCIFKLYGKKLGIILYSVFFSFIMFPWNKTTVFDIHGFRLVLIGPIMAASLPSLCMAGSALPVLASRVMRVAVKNANGIQKARGLSFKGLVAF
jgi:hypothetical protein